MNPCRSIGLSLALLVCLGLPVRADDSARTPQGLDPFHFFSFAYAANHFEQKGWFGSPDGNAERIGIRLDEHSESILIELPPGVGDEAGPRLTALLQEQGWEPGDPSNNRAGHGPIYSYPVKRMGRAAGWNHQEISLNLDQLVELLRKLGGRPLFLGVRAPERVELSSTPPPLAAGVFYGARYAFYRLGEKDNGVFTLRYGVPDPMAGVAVGSALFWLLFPLVAALLARLILAMRKGASEKSDARWRVATSLTQSLTALGAWLTLFLQYDVLRLMTLPIGGLSPHYAQMNNWVIPFGVLALLWATATCALLRPRPSTVFDASPAG